MAMTPEATFHQWLHRNMFATWRMVRIETTTSSGVPDLHVTYKYHPYTEWIELKALPEQNVQIRAMQYAWGMAHPRWCAPLILNRDPKSNWVSAWRFPFEVKPGRKGHVKIISDPLLACPQNEFPEAVALGFDIDPDKYET